MTEGGRVRETTGCVCPGGCHAPPFGGCSGVDGSDAASGWDWEEGG